MRYWHSVKLAIQGAPLDLSGAASMTIHVSNICPDEAVQPAIPIGIPTLVKMAFDGMELAPVWNALVTRVNDNANDAAALIDLSTIALLQGRPNDRVALQHMAFELKRIYRQPSKSGSAAALKVLAFMAPGDFMDSMPIEFLLEHSNVTLDMVYVLPGLPLPNPLPEHDVALVCVGESRENQVLLSQLAALLNAWPRPVVNRPEHIARLTRVGTWDLLKSVPEIIIPMQADMDRSQLERIALGKISIPAVLGGSTFPIIARPVDSHAGEGLAKLDCESDIATYLDERPELEFCIAPFVDYQGEDGLFRKYRVALIDGRPYAVHMAISQHWMIHYLNADMRDNAERRAEEARFMADFDKEFAVRHKSALDAIAHLTGLEYLPFDCGETLDGKLLVFETGTNMIVHSMDPADLFPYKPAQMDKVFGAFQAMLQKASGRNERRSD
jgi:hypothetical protein